MSEIPSLSANASDLEEVTRPLLRLIQYVTSMETSFVTSIDWEMQQQEVLFALNTGDMQVSERSTLPWADSMCRSMLLSGNVSTDQVGSAVHATSVAHASGMQSFVALPILVADRPVGTVCAASQRHVELDELQIEALQLVADALQRLIAADRARKDAEARAITAEWKAQIALAEAARERSAGLHPASPVGTNETTGLPNLHSFTLRWEDELARSGRRHFSVGLVLIELDVFAEGKGRSGQSVPVDLLQAMAAILMGIAHRADLVAQLGDATFAIVMTQNDLKGLESLAEFVRRAFANAVSHLGIDATICLGVASSEVSPRHRLLADAEAAITLCREAGGNRATVFSAND